MAQSFKILPSPVAFIRFISLLGLVIIPLGCSAQGPKSADSAFGNRVKAYLMAHPEVIEEASNALQKKKQDEENQKAQASLTQYREDLTNKADDPSLGHGKTTLVEFFDYRCGYCKAAAPQLQAFLQQHPQIRVVFKEFPILSPISEKAAEAALAAARQGKYTVVHFALMNAPDLDEATIDRVLRDNGVDLSRAHVDMKSRAVQNQLNNNRSLARAIGINGTPTFIINDKFISGFSEADILSSLPDSAAKS